MKRWSHIHSLATGLVFGLILDREALVLFALGILLGAALVFASRYARRAVGFVREQTSRLSSARADALLAKARLDEAEAARKLAAAAELTARAERHVRTAKEQEAAERVAYLRGAADDEHHREIWLEESAS